MNRKQVYILFLPLLFCTNLFAEIVQMNAAYLHNPPKWMKRTKVEKAINRIQRKLEWSTRRINVYYHSTESSFQRAHTLGPAAIAVAVKSNKSQEVHLSPRVTKDNYQQVIGHEFVHIIIHQKYRGAIPRWLEEGMANHLSREESINYKWLSKQQLPRDITLMSHPFRQSIVPINVHYRASQALAEMLDKKCNLERLLQLSVQRKMENYIKTYCEIDDINMAFRQWVKKKAG